MRTPKNRHSRILIMLLSAIAIVSLMSVFALPVSASPALTNGGFETGDISGWKAPVTGGYVMCTDGWYGEPGARTASPLYLPVEGSRFAVVYGGYQDTWANLTQTFNAKAGDVLSGYSFFKAGDYLPYDDEAQVRIIDANTHAELYRLFYSSVSSVGDYRETPWTHWNYYFTTTGQYILEAGVVNRGDSGYASFLGIDAVFVDQTPPVITSAISPLPNAAGWNNTNTTVTWTISDPESGIFATTNSAPVTLTSDTASQTITCTATNGVGMTTSASVTIKLDKTPPTVAYGAAAAPPNANGWYAADVTVPFTAGDALSGLKTVNKASPLVLTAEGAAVTGAVTVTDVAGNTATIVTPTAYKIDKTPPVIQSAVSPAPNANGWNNTPVTVGFTATDAISGVAVYPVSVNVTGEGAGQTVV
uniref:Uncharacterized protein n=1 Tax=uncultured Dehalococcoidia bacterium TaxID=498747 RepID=A0A871Y7N8_9CHLR|nr:hypothetical protein HULAa30F3_00035 [uncultured Dehalococcoidia bacterium]